MCPETLIDLYDKCITVKEAAAKLGIKERYCRRLCQQGKLKAEKIGGSWFIYKDRIKSPV